MLDKYAKRDASIVLVVGMLDSIHVARWMEQFRDRKTCFIFFPSSGNRRIHKNLIAFAADRPEPLTIFVRGSKFLTTLLLPVDLLGFRAIRRYWLARVIRRFRPQVIHVLEIQHGGYLLNEQCVQNSQIYLTNYGSDIYWFQHFARHQKKIARVLRFASHYFCECNRDVELALKYGFAGVVMNVRPNAGLPRLGGLESLIESKNRKLILIKGYTGFVGRALIALHSLRHTTDLLVGHTILVYSASLRARIYVAFLKSFYDLNIRAIRKHKLSHDEMIKNFQHALLHIGVSDSDGISTAVLESMANGCFPIQSQSSCCTEFLEHKVGAYILDSNSSSSVAQAIRFALTNSEIVEAGQRSNYEKLSKWTVTDVFTNPLKDVYRIY